MVAEFKGRVNPNHTEVVRDQCIEYVQKNYEEWPQPFSTWHTAVCHFGYSWEQLTHQGPWVLKHRKTQDVITEEDYKSYVKKPVNVSVAWLKLDDDGQILESSTEDKSTENGWTKFLAA